jgi:diapolycopene oxygenase
MTAQTPADRPPRGSARQVAVIGAGLGGMSAAISLASAGFEVSVYEKNDKVGGKLNLLEQDGYSFDLGPSILTLPQIFRKLFAAAGHDLDHYVKIMPVNPHWRNFFEDGTVIDLSPDPAAMREQLTRLGGDGLDTEFEGFLKYCKQQYRACEAGYLNKAPDSFLEAVRTYPKGQMLKLDFRRTMDRAVRHHISEPHLRDIFDFFIKYVGSAATRAPAFMNMLTAVQFEYGLWYVDGGMYNLAKAFAQLMTELGISVRLNCEVRAITTENDRVTGIQLADGTTVASDYVVSNMEVVPAYRDLLREDQKWLARLRKFEPACSGLVLHLGVDRPYPQLAHHNFFYSRDQRRHFSSVFRDYKLPDDPTIYVVAPTRTDAGQAPAGCDNIKILPHIPHLNDKHPYTREDYLAYKEVILDKLERMGLEDLRKHVVVEHVWTPFDIRDRYYSHQGAIYGVVSDLRKNFAFKAPKQSRKYRNLFFTGGSVNPGGGMPMVTLCGQQVCDKIRQQEADRIGH